MRDTRKIYMIETILGIEQPKNVYERRMWLFHRKDRVLANLYHKALATPAKPVDPARHMALVEDDPLEAEATAAYAARLARPPSGMSLAELDAWIAKREAHQAWCLAHPLPEFEQDLHDQTCAQWHFGTEELVND